MAERRIIDSLLDLDYYKLTMGQVALERFPAVPVVYAFINRTESARVADAIDEEELRAELAHVQSLRFTAEELAYLRESEHIQRGLFSERYLAFLAALRLPDLDVSFEGPELSIEASGPWPEAILWETIVLSIVTELYGRSAVRREGRTEDEAWQDGERRLEDKILRLRNEPRVRFTDFGTRRRYSGAWQRHVVQRMLQALPEQCLGTSNVLLAKELATRPIGTYAHEMDMILSGVYHGGDEEVRASHHKVLDVWWEWYGEPLSIALSDTYGTEYFFRAFAKKHAERWRGVRHDSGDPFDFAERTIDFYEGMGIDPRAKQIVFSDGLTVETMIGLVERFHGHVGVLFGWGTNLTNDLGFDPPSLIMKPVESCGHHVVKLTDNLDKAVGSPEEIERFVRIFGYEAPPPRLGVRY